MSLIYVAGSGPSSKGHRSAHVVTKKKKNWEYDYIVLPRGNWITHETEKKAVSWDKYEGKRKWQKYYEKFTSAKPSNGLMAVFVAIDKYDPDEICLIGFDNVLKGVKATQHKWAAEKACIESLVKIVDAPPRTPVKCRP